MSTLGENFKRKLLNEATVSASDVTDKFTSTADKAIVSLMITLGAPAAGLSRYKTSLKKSIETASDLFISSTQFRTWVKKLNGAIDKSQQVEEANFSKKLSTKMQKLIYAILVSLGLPPQVERESQKALLAGIKAMAALALDNSSIKTSLLAIGKIFEHDTDMSEDIVKEDVSANETQTGLIDLLKKLGFDTSANRSIEAQAARSPSMQIIKKLDAAPTVGRRLAALNDAVTKLVHSSDNSSI